MFDRQTAFWYVLALNSKAVTRKRRDYLQKEIPRGEGVKDEDTLPGRRPVELFARSYMDGLLFQRQILHTRHREDTKKKVGYNMNCLRN